MTTVVDALTDATAELHNAALLFQTRADQVATQLASFTANAQTTINNFLVRPSEQGWAVHETAGVDAPGRGDIAHPFKTFDYCVSQMDRSVSQVVFALSDITITKVYVFPQGFKMIGAVAAGGVLGNNYIPTHRSLKFLPEAANSPVVGLGRCTAGLSLYGPYSAILWMDPVLPATPAGLDNATMFYFQGSNFTISNSVVSAETAGTAARLFQTFDGASVKIATAAFTIGTNAAGKIFVGVAAGQNPNTASYQYETNLTAA